MKTAWEGAQTTLQIVMMPKIEPGGYYSDCRLAKANPIASDEVAGKKLWESSVQAVHDFLNK